jgi:Fic family protein
MEESRFFELDAKLESLRGRRQAEDPRILEAFQEKIDIGWIYHDNALEGVVLSYSEIRDALDRKIISDVSLVNLYEEIRNHKAAIDFVREEASKQSQARKKTGLVTLELIKQMHEILTPEDKSKGNPYRKDNPLHRAYYHEIATPDKIPLRMRKLCEWLDEEEVEQMHPMARAAGAHYRLMSIYPWTKNSGKVGRLLLNLLLLRDGYPPAIVHSIERQRYYDALRAENGQIGQLLLESLNTYVGTANRFFDELAEVRRPGGKAAS